MPRSSQTNFLIPLMFMRKIYRKKCTLHANDAESNACPHIKSNIYRWRVEKYDAFCYSLTTEAPPLMAWRAWSHLWALISVPPITEPANITRSPLRHIQPLAAPQIYYSLRPDLTAKLSVIDPWPDLACPLSWRLDTRLSLPHTPVACESLQSTICIVVNKFCISFMNGRYNSCITSFVLSESKTSGAD